MQLEAMIDTCGFGKDISNVQTRSMLALLATCMLGISSEENNKLIPNESSSLSMDMNMYLEAVKSLEERVYEKNCEIYHQIENNSFCMKNLKENVEEVEKMSKSRTEEAKKELARARVQVEDLRV